MASTISYSRTKPSAVPAYSALAILVLCVIALLSYLWKQDAPREGVVLSKFAQHPYPAYFQPTPVETTLPTQQVVAAPEPPAAKAPEGESRTSELKVAEVPRYGADASPCVEADILDNMPTSQAVAQAPLLFGEGSGVSCVMGLGYRNLMHREDLMPADFFALRSGGGWAVEKEVGEDDIKRFLSNGKWTVFDLEQLFEQAHGDIHPYAVTLLMRALRERGSTRVKELLQKLLNEKSRGLCESYFYERISPEKEQQERDFFCK